MAENKSKNSDTESEVVSSQTAEDSAMQGGAYEVLRKRLLALDGTICERLGKLNTARKEIFGSNVSEITGNERIQTDNNCIPRDVTGVDNYLLFGFNVFVGLRAETKLTDVFAVYSFDGKEFIQIEPKIFSDQNFIKDFKELYRYYKNARFLQFIRRPESLLLIFQIGESIDDVKIFRFEIKKDHTLEYVDNRGDLVYKLPQQHDFEWTLISREQQVSGDYPHISILDQVFVECINGDLTIKIENNTSTGEGLYSEPVENKDQTLDDAIIYYAVIGELILLKIKPYLENDFRLFVFNKKTETAVRIDSIENACIQLPEDHGIIFPQGYYLNDGTTKRFEDNIEGMNYLECIKSPNGEDFLYVFYNEEQGLHVLIQYNLITKELANPIFCHGYSLFNDGKMVLFNSPDSEPKRNHSMQIWQTSFYSDTFDAKPKTTSFLTKIGNKDLVKGISEGYGISKLITNDTVNFYTYRDIIKSVTSMLISYHWLDNAETFNIKESLLAIKQSANSAVDEFEKVVRIKKDTATQIKNAAEQVRICILDSDTDGMGNISQFVNLLDRIRNLRGQVISLLELRYSDNKLIEELDEKLSEIGEAVSTACVEHLLKKNALQPYTRTNAEIVADLEKIKKIADLKPLNESLEQLAHELDLLTDIVNNLKIDDATKTTTIVDNITDVYAALNRTRATLRNLRKDLGKNEAKAEFAAQFKLVSQSITNYIGMCDSIEKCDEYLTKLMVNIEELEGHFADYEEYVEQLTEKREEAYSAFTARKQILSEDKKRRATSMESSAKRILKGVINRAESFKNIDEINSYFASDLMVSKFREIIYKLKELEESVKAEELTGKLKSAKDEILRRLRDNLDLFESGENLIKFGDYKFTVNTEKLELTTIYRDGKMYFHLTGTDFYELISDEEFLTTEPMWEQQIVSENKIIYRGEYLAYKILMDSVNNRENLSLDLLNKSSEADEPAMLDLVRKYSASLYNEGYEKGIHDNDATLILEAIVKLYNSCELLRYDSTSRAHAIIFWSFYDNKAQKKIWRNKMKSFGAMASLFNSNEQRFEYIEEIQAAMSEFFNSIDRQVEPAVLSHAAEYLYYELQDQEELLFTINALAVELHKNFLDHLKDKKVDKTFLADIAKITNVKSKINLIYDWVATYVKCLAKADSAFLIWEVVALIASNEIIHIDESSVSTYVQVKELFGQHPLISEKTLNIYFDRFLLKLKHFNDNHVPMYDKYVSLRSSITDTCRKQLRLNEFKPKVMSGFVRNKLIDDVYLNLVGANFAKQMGVSGKGKRTDLMGLLLLISPPGYGKTTLMEYIADRMGLIFIKINGPAIGHKVTSLDPAEAPNATAKEELKKLNLSLEMGNNIMIYLDDIQHVNPELLQKFISLCDAQRKIEGVYKGETRTYDLRGKKVAVVMAGNPYTESGDKFQIPDMLANRADTYNLGDISSSAADSFDMSFIENSITSNSVLSTISTHSHEDIYRFMQVVDRNTQEGIEFDHSYSSTEINEIVNVLKKLYKIRDVVLNVNKQYIYSAAQQDDYRTEPGFKLQGSYRNMNKMVEKVYPVMTDKEVDQVIIDHYFNEAQTLTSGAESNVLKFKEIMGIMSSDDTKRWQKIKDEFNRRQSLAGVDDSDDIGKLVAQLSAFNANMGNVNRTIENSMDDGVNKISSSLTKLVEKEQNIDLTSLVETLKSIEKAQQHLTVESPFPEEYAKALVKQGKTLGDLTPVFESICENSTSYVRLRELLEKLINGEITLQLVK